MANPDLLKWVTSDVDFYELLGITFEQFTESELRRAYRKTALKYHPDKVGKAFDPDKYELFQAAHDVLADAELKAKYDNHRHAKIQRQRANDLFEGKRRTMKEELEARERGAPSTAGIKRPREDESRSEMQQELRRLAEEGRKRRAARTSMMAENTKVDVAASPTPPTPQKEKVTEAEEQPQKEDDEIEILERKIREAEQAKAKRRAEKKARKSGIFVPADSPAIGSAAKKDARFADENTATPIKRPDIFKGLKADEKSSASPKFSFSPNTPKSDFSATMARLKAAEKQRLEDEIRQQEAESAT